MFLGAILKAKNNDGHTALELAKKNARKDVADYLQLKISCSI
jgi:hypothetical protein